MPPTGYYDWGLKFMAHQNRKLIVCCDGTWNEPYQIGTTTNVVKMVRAIRPDSDGVSQLVYYHPGVGTGNWVDRLMGGTMGIGLSSNVQSAYDFLATNFMDGDDIYLFGFSRGAFTARSLAGLVGLVGLLEKRDMDLFPRVYDIYRSRKHRHALKSGQKEQVELAVRTLFPNDGQQERLVDALVENARPTPIFFIGVWDTVGALGIPFGPLRWIGQAKYNFHDTELSDRIRFAYHALAIDEARNSFKPTLWTRPQGRGTDRKRASKRWNRSGSQALIQMLAADIRIAGCPTLPFFGWWPRRRPQATRMAAGRLLSTKNTSRKKSTRQWVS